MQAIAPSYYLVFDSTANLVVYAAKDASVAVGVQAPGLVARTFIHERAGYTDSDVIVHFDQQTDDRGRHPSARFVRRLRQTMVQLLGPSRSRTTA